MNTKDAAEKFNLGIQDVRDRYKDGMILGANTIKGRINIPDDTEIIPCKRDVQTFLLEIIKYKNNNRITISRKLCPDKKSLCTVAKYSYNRGFIGEYTFDPNIKTLFQNLSLTDEGLAYVIGAGRMKHMSVYSIHPITLNQDIKVGLINIG